VLLPEGLLVVVVVVVFMMVCSVYCGDIKLSCYSFAIGCWQVFQVIKPFYLLVSLRLIVILQTLTLLLYKNELPISDTTILA